MNIEDAKAELVSRNNISIGDTVIYFGQSKLYPRANMAAQQAKLSGNQKYTVQWVFLGEDCDLIELEGFDDYTFPHDMFVRIGGK